MFSWSFKSKFNGSPQINCFCLLLEQEQRKLEFICAVSGCRLLELWSFMAIWTGARFVVCDQVSWFQPVIYGSCPQPVWAHPGAAGMIYFFPYFDIDCIFNTNLAKDTCNRQLLGNSKCTCYFKLQDVKKVFLIQRESLANTALWWNNSVNMFETRSTAGLVELCTKRHKKSVKIIWKIK